MPIDSLSPDISSDEEDIAPAPPWLVPLLRAISTAKGVPAQLQAVREAACVAAIPLHYGAYEKQEIFDRIYRSAEAVGLVKEASPDAVQLAMREGYEQGLAALPYELPEYHPPRSTAQTADQKAEAAINEALGATALHAVPHVGRPEKVFDAVQLSRMEFEPIKTVVPGIFVEGLTLFCGKPKIGKSWLLLHAAHAIASGGWTLGDTHCIEGDVLYCALEDTERRLKSRMNKLYRNQPRSPRLKFTTKMGRLAQGGLDFLRAWIASVKNPRLIVIDTLAMVRMPNRNKDQSVYDADYAALVELRNLAHEFHIAIVVVHHTRKMHADDPFDTISGTLGLTASTDSIVLLHRETNCTTLRVRGRDLEELEKAITFNKDAATWTIQGDAHEVRQSEERQAIIAGMREMEGPQNPTEIATATGMKLGNIRRMLPKMAKDGLLKKAGYGKYEVAPKPEPKTYDF
jgi:RecA-family ATPase